MSSDIRDRIGGQASVLTSGSAMARRLVLRRVALTPVILLGVTFVVFAMAALSPNDPAYAALPPFADDAMRAQFVAEHGLDDPLIVRYVRFLWDLVHLRLGDPLIRSEPVAELVGRALPITIQVMLVAMVLAVSMSFVLGIWAASRENRLADRVIGAVASVMQASPDFWIGLLFIYAFAVTLDLLPSGGYVPISRGVVPWFRSLIGPSLVLAMPFTGAMTRVVRTSIAEELTKDYVRTAVGVGVAWPVVICRNVLRNALVTPITVLGVYVGALMSGAILVEVVFDLPGMGSLLISGVNAGDLAVVRGVAIVGAASFVVANLLVDLAYLALEPRSAEASAQ